MMAQHLHAATAWQDQAAHEFAALTEAQTLSLRAVSVKYQCLGRKKAEQSFRLLSRLAMTKYVDVIETSVAAAINPLRQWQSASSHAELSSVCDDFLAVPRIYLCSDLLDTLSEECICMKRLCV